MTDVSHWVGYDLSVDATGDLAAASGSDETSQRVLRRLITSQGSYIWHLEYGMGLPRRIGQIQDNKLLATVITSQMYLEQGVSHDPQPQVSLEDIPSGVFAKIAYTEFTNGKPQTLAFNVAGR